MDIILDGRSGLIAPSAGAKLGVVLAQVDAIVRGLGREVVELKLDGDVIAAGDPAAKERSPDDFERLEVRTLPQLAIVHALVERSRAVLPSLAQALPKRAEELRATEPAAALGGLKPILDAISLVRNALDLGRDVHLPGDRPEALSASMLAAEIAKIDASLIALDGALQKPDMDAAAASIGVQLHAALPDLEKAVAALGDALPPLPPAPEPPPGSPAAASAK